MINEHKDIAKPSHRELRLKKLHTEPTTFQPRSIEIDYGHVADLAKVLVNGKALDPIQVRRVGDGSFTVLDGHHSFAAYHEAKWRGPVPVLVYNCTVAEGQQIAARENSKPRLQMKDEEKRDWAWRLTTDQPELSRTQVGQLCNVSPSTVSRMRRVRECLNENEVEPPKSWKAAQNTVKGNEPFEWSDEQQDEWRRAAFTKLKENIARDIAQYNLNAPELVLEVVQECMGKSHFAIGLEYLGFHEGEIDEFTGEFTSATELRDGKGEC